MKLIKIGAEWCSACKIMDERLENFTECSVVKYDADNEDDETLSVIDKYKVRNIPVIILEDDNGNMLNKWVGAVNINDIRMEIKKYV